MTEPAPRLAVEHLVKHYPVRGTGSGRAASVRALDGVSLAVGPGETLGLVGESGSGKSTLARAIVRLVEPDAGRVLYRARDGGPAVDLCALAPRALRALRRELGIVFQDPRASLNPRLSAGAMVAEVLRVHRLAATQGEAGARVAALFAEVGLDSELARAWPHELSGGERQRVALARVLAAEPRLLVCDEATASLDVTVQARILALLLRLQAERGLTYVFIAHDLSVVRALGGCVAVMYLGRVVESGPVAEVFATPAHPYTRALLDALPRGEPGAPRAAPPAGEPPSAVRPPPGCRFHPRCPLAIERCRTEEPAERRIAPGRRAACHLVE